jgi:hypothetical protein
MFIGATEKKRGEKRERSFCAAAAAAVDVCVYMK